MDPTFVCSGCLDFPILIIAKISSVFRCSRELKKLILVAAGGIFLLQISLWTYFAFNAVTREKPGSFRLRGVPYALQQAENWNFRILTDIIRKHYLYPEPAPLYTRPRPENSDDLMIRGIKEAEQSRQSLDL